jgi:ssDNA-binding Zn-finger/Zn-ribbon topoisomerase 1
LLEPRGVSADIGEHPRSAPQEHHMPQAHVRPDPSLLPIERPRCPKCQGRMMLSRIEPGPGGSDLPTFECAKCGQVHKLLAEDPMKSAKVQWHNSNLNSPT